VHVTTIVPGLMRTGSHVNAQFKGDAEYGWFALGASLPLISMDAERAARQIVQATKHGEAERILSIPATLAARFHGLFPGLTADLLGMVNHVLPTAEQAVGSERGMEAQTNLQSPLLNKLTGWGFSAARRFNQQPETTPRPGAQRKRAA